MRLPEGATIGPPVQLPPGIVPPRDTGKARGKAKRSKYRAVPTVVDGIRFASKKEAKRYGELKLMLKAGAISRLELQPEFPLDVVGQYRREKIGTYVADFSFWSEGKRIVEDVKGFKTPLYKWKKKHVEAQYGVKIVEI